MLKIFLGCLSKFKVTNLNDVAEVENLSEPEFMEQADCDVISILNILHLVFSAFLSTPTLSCSESRIGLFFPPCLPEYKHLLKWKGKHIQMQIMILKCFILLHVHWWEPKCLTTWIQAAVNKSWGDMSVRLLSAPLFSTYRSYFCICQHLRQWLHH